MRLVTHWSHRHAFSAQRPKGQRSLHSAQRLNRQARRSLARNGSSATLGSAGPQGVGDRIFPGPAAAGLVKPLRRPAGPPPAEAAAESRPQATERRKSTAADTPESPRAAAPRSGPAGRRSSSLEDAALDPSESEEAPGPAAGGESPAARRRGVDGEGLSAAPIDGGCLARRAAAKAARSAVQAA